MSSDQSSPQQNFHGRNVNCDQVQISSSNFSNEQVRAIIHCLNAHGKIEAFEKLIDATSDQELAPLSSWLNELVTRQPKTLFTLRELYHKSIENGDLTELETLLAKMLSDSENNLQFKKVIAKVSDPLLTLAFDEQINFNQTGLYAFLKANAFQRIGAEYFLDQGLEKFLVATARYVNAEDALPIQDLYHFLADANLDQTFQAAIKGDQQTEKIHVQNLAHFFDWLTQDDHYGVVSRGVRQMMAASVVCFANDRKTPNPVTLTLAKISAMDVKSVKSFIGHDIKNLDLFAQGYCNFPFQKTELLHVIDEGIQVQGFDEVFLTLKPLLTRPDFIAFLGSAASENFIKEIGYLNQKHFFQDLFTLMALHLQSPISDNGDHVALALDGFFKPLNTQDVQSLMKFIGPLLSAENLYGAKTAGTLNHISETFPDTHLSFSRELKLTARSSLDSIFSKPEVSPALDLSAKLIRQGTLNALIDQFFGYLSHATEQGRHPLPPPRIVKNFAGFKIPSASYLLEKTKDGPKRTSICDQINFDWKFTRFSVPDSQDYLRQLNAIQKCVDANQTFAKAQDLIAYSIAKSSYGFVLTLQQNLVDTLLTVNPKLSVDTVEDFFSLSSSDLKTMRKVFELSSSALGFVKTAYLAQDELRKFIADLIRSPELPRAVAELTDTPPKRLRSTSPTLDLVNLTHADAVIDSGKILRQVPVLDAVKAIMQEYCPSLNDEMPDCDIDSDQVTLFKQSPGLLYQQMAHEELDSLQSWMHPQLQQKWKHQVTRPADVGTFEYHLNPALHLLNHSSQAPQAILNVLKRIQKDGIALDEFLKSRALRFTVIPYVYQVPNYPEQTAREFHTRTRIRILNDLDRYELFAINSDFKAFNILSNVGMNLIREIALSWGDVPASERPASLVRYVNSSQVKTLSEVKDYIETEMSHYDSRSLQELGNCDSRGRGRLDRWWANHFCSSELSDISARIFNLRFLIPLLDEELPLKDGGRGGLVFLRDLFYSLYEMNSDAQRNQYGNGVSLKDICLESPLTTGGPAASCQKDLLTEVSRITRLGLLHQAGMAVVQAQDHPVDAISSLLNRVANQPDVASAFVKAASSDGGMQFLSDAVNYGFQAPIGVAQSLSLLTQTLALPKNLTWANLAFELIQKDPRFLAENKALLNSILTLDTHALAPRVDHWRVNSRLATPEFLEFGVNELTPAARKGIVDFVSSLAPQSSSLAETLSTAKKLPEFDTKRLKKDVHAWALEFARPELAPTRNEFAEWTTTPEFSKFCAVFSDSVLVTKTYNFLESANQQAGTHAFIESCRDYLNLH